MGTNRLVEAHLLEEESLAACVRAGKDSPVPRGSDGRAGERVLKFFLAFVTGGAVNFSSISGERVRPDYLFPVGKAW